MSTAHAARTWGDVIKTDSSGIRWYICSSHADEDGNVPIRQLASQVAVDGIEKTARLRGVNEDDIRLALRWLALDRPPLDQPIPVERGPWVPGSSHEKVLYQRLRDTLPDLHELAAVALSVTVKHWLADAQRFDECEAPKSPAAHPQATAEEPKPAEPPSDLPPGYAAIPDPAFDRLCYHVESGDIYTRKLAKTGAPNPSDSQHALAGIVFVGWRFDPAKLAAWQAEQAKAAPKVSREFVEGADIEASVGLGMHGPDQAYLTFIGVLAERVAAMETRLAEQAERQHETASNVSTIRGTLFRTDVRISRLESAKPQPVAVEQPDERLDDLRHLIDEALILAGSGPDSEPVCGQSSEEAAKLQWDALTNKVVEIARCFDGQTIPTTVDAVRRAEQLLTENPVDVPEELLDPARLLKPEPPTSEPDVPPGLLESDDGEPRYREADISVYPWVYGEAEYLTKNGIPASSVAEGLRLVVADAVKEVPGLNIKLAPADAVVVEWSTEPPKEDGGGWAQLKNGECRAGFWRHRAGMHFAIGGLAIEAHDIARYLMLPRPGVKS